MEKEITWQQVLDEHWRQFKLAVQSLNYENKMLELNWREYVLYEMCNRHNEEIGEKYFLFQDDTIIEEEN